MLAKVLLLTLMQQSFSRFLQHPFAKVLSLVISCVLIWTSYFWWRPPQLLLGVTHVEHLDPRSQTVALTFDDAPHPLTTPMLLASLHNADVKATFFAVGDNLEMYPQLAHDIISNGHKLANHSQNHHNLTTLTTTEQGPEMEECFEVIRKLGGNTHLFRPPGGGLDWRALRYMHQHQITLAWWSNNVGDWAPMPAWAIVRHFRQTLRAGDIVLLHDAGTSTPQALPTIVREARAKGWRFVLMPENTD